MIKKTILLGDFIRLLAAQPPSNRIIFDFGGYAPGGFMSYRGFYDHLALSYDTKYSVTVEEVLNESKIAATGIYSGYKGGTYRASMSTPIWAANWGESHWTGITSVYGTDSGLSIIETGYCEAWSLG